MPKICFVLDVLELGGVERITVNLANEFAAQGFEVDIVIVKDCNLSRGSIDENVRIIGFGASRVLNGLPSLVRYFFREKPIAVVSARDHLNIIVYAAAKMVLFRGRLILTLHNLIRLNEFSNVPRYKVKLSNWLARFVYSKCYALVAVSKAVAEDHAAFFGLSVDKIKVIYNPIITPRLFALAGCEAERIPLIVSAGRLSPEKDYSTLIRAFALVSPVFGSRLVILGEGPQRSMLQALADELGLAGLVSFPGYTDNPYPLIKSARVFVLSSITEALPSVLVEALALGTPVVSTDCEGAREILLNGRLGRISPAGDHQKLAQAILDTLELPLEWNSDDLTPYSASCAFQEYRKLVS